MVQIANPRPRHAAAAPEPGYQPPQMIVSRRAYLLSRPSQRVMRAAGRSAASTARKAARGDLAKRHADLLRDAGVPEAEIARQTGFAI
jgi:hypothetical protein